MKIATIVTAALLVSLVSMAALAAQGANPNELYNRAKRAITAGTVVPERDLAPLVDLLRGPSSDDDLGSAIGRIETLGGADASSPAAVKQYLLEQSTPLLLKIAASGASASVRGDAVTALRDMGASRAVLEQAATIAERDRDAFMRSRGEMLRNFIKSMPAGGAAAEVKSAGGPREQQAIASLKARKLGVSADQLRRSSLEGNAADVQSLLDAGVNVNSGSGLSDGAIYYAVFSGCGQKQGETDGLVNTVNVLIAAGADLKRKDDNGNNILISAAQMCGPKIVGALIAGGADMKIINGSGMTPLTIALIMRHPDSAEVLVNKGARLTAAQVQMVSASATDPRSKAVIQRAAGQ